MKHVHIQSKHVTGLDASYECQVIPRYFKCSPSLPSMFSSRVHFALPSIQFSARNVLHKRHREDVKGPVTRDYCFVL